MNSINVASGHPNPLSPSRRRVPRSLFVLSGLTLMVGIGLGGVLRSRDIERLQAERESHLQSQTQMISGALEKEVNRLKVLSFQYEDRVRRARQQTLFLPRKGSALLWASLELDRDQVSGIRTSLTQTISQVSEGQVLQLLLSETNVLQLRSQKTWATPVMASSTGSGALLLFVFLRTANSATAIVVDPDQLFRPHLSAGASTGDVKHSIYVAHRTGQILTQKEGSESIATSDRQVRLTLENSLIASNARARWIKGDRKFVIQGQRIPGTELAVLMKSNRPYQKLDFTLIALLAATLIALVFYLLLRRQNRDQTYEAPAQEMETPYFPQPATTGVPDWANFAADTPAANVGTNALQIPDQGPNVLRAQRRSETMTQVASDIQNQRISLNENRAPLAQKAPLPPDSEQPKESTEERTLRGRVPQASPEIELDHTPVRDLGPQPTKGFAWPQNPVQNHSGFDQQLMAASSHRELYIRLTRQIGQMSGSPTLFLTFHSPARAALLFAYSGFDEASPPSQFSVPVSSTAEKAILDITQEGEFASLVDYPPLRRKLMDRVGIAHFDAWALTSSPVMTDLGRAPKLAGVVIILQAGIRTAENQKNILRLLRVAGMTYDRLYEPEYESETGSETGLEIGSEAHPSPDSPSLS